MNIHSIRKLFPLQYIAVEDDHRSILTDETRVENSSDNQLSQMLFAPDPDTGIPRSDIAVLMSADTRPEIANYIRDTLLRPRPHVAGVDDPDVALETAQSRFETTAQYAERLRMIAESRTNEE